MHGTFLHFTEAKNWHVRVLKRGCHNNSCIFGRNNLVKLVPFSQNVASKVKLDNNNHILEKDASEYCRCKQCGGRSIYL